MHNVFALSYLLAFSNKDRNIYNFEAICMVFKHNEAASIDKYISTDFVKTRKRHFLTSSSQGRRNRGARGLYSLQEVII
jgi:hypothetical protein